MRTKNSVYLGATLLTGALLCASAAFPRQRQAASGQAEATYDIKRETTLAGKVLSYTPDSGAPPLGAHVVVQTLYGPVDVHLGSAKLLEQSGFTLHAGDSVRITGEVVRVGQSSTFAARIIENGEQSITVRNAKGRLILVAPVHAPRGVQ